MASGTSARTGVFLDGWFLNSPDLKEDTDDVLSHISTWNLADSGFAEPTLDDPERLPLPLDEVFKSLWVKRKVRDWCRDSSIWQSLHHETYRNAAIDLFPQGSTASRIAALTLAERLRDENRTVLISPSVGTDESQVSADWFIQECAKQTWKWLDASEGKGSLNLTLCSSAFKRGYIWVAVLPKTLPDKKDLVLYDWDDGAKTPRNLQLPREFSFYGNIAFLNHYLRESDPDPSDPMEKELSRDYQEDKSRLDGIASLSQNDKLRIVLEAWLDWRLSEEEKRKRKQEEEEEEKKQEEEERKKKQNGEGKGISERPRMKYDREEE